MFAHVIVSPPRTKHATRLIVVLATGLLASACSSGGSQDLAQGLLGNSSSAQEAALAQAGQPPVASTGNAELDKALAYWGDKHKKAPQDAKTAVSFARNLKAAGHKQHAFEVLQTAAMVNGDSKELASEMGRLAIEFEQIAMAEKLLAMADDPLRPDWRVISARGTVMAKQSKFAEAIPFFERAMKLAPAQPSVLNNLAMAHAANGDPVKAEEILRQAVGRSNDPKIKQNLALVLGLQGKHDEAGVTRVAVAPTTSADTDYIKRMVRATPATTPAAPTRAVATAPARPARAIEVRSTSRQAPANGLRAGGGPADVAAPTGSWSTSVSVAR
jgi:Flp pilus assembly protein TadD